MHQGIRSTGARESPQIYLWAHNYSPRAHDCIMTHQLLLRPAIDHQICLALMKVMPLLLVTWMKS